MIRITVLCLTLLAFALPAFALRTEPPRVEEVGGCLIVYIRDGEGVAPDLTQECKKVKPISWWGKTIGQFYEWAPPMLAAAFDCADDALEGITKKTTGKRHIRLVVVPDALPNLIIRPSATSVDMAVSTSFINFVQAMTAGSMLDTLAEAADAGGSIEVPDGIGFSEWLCAVRVGFGDRRFWAPWPGPSKLPTTEWMYKFAILPSTSVYAFVFGHELAHLTTGISSGGVGDEQLQIEARMDRVALQKLADQEFTIPGRTMTLKGAILPPLIVEWMIGMRYYEKLNSSGLYSQTTPASERFPLPGNPLTFDEKYPARMSEKRAALLVDEWEKICKKSSGDNSGICGGGWKNAMESERKLLASPLPADADTAKAEFKNVVEQLVRETPSGFKNILGPKRKTAEGLGKSFESKVNLPGAKETAIWMSSDEPSLTYVSSLMFDGRNAELAKQVYEQVVPNLKEALSDAWAVTEDSYSQGGVDIRSKRFRREDSDVMVSTSFCFVSRDKSYKITVTFRNN